MSPNERQIPGDPLIIIDEQGEAQISTRVDEWNAPASAYYALATLPGWRRGSEPSDIVNVSPPGMRWQMWVDVATMIPAWFGLRGELNYSASLLPTQFGAKVPLLYGPVVITHHETEESPPAATWTYMLGLIDDIGAVVAGKEPLHAARDIPSWTGALTLLSHVLRRAPRPELGIEWQMASQEERNHRAAEAVLLTEERVERALTHGLENA